MGGAFLGRAETDSLRCLGFRAVVRVGVLLSGYRALGL